MKAFLKWYLRRVLSRPFAKAIGWTNEERAAFDLFARTSCGIKLFEFLRQIVANATFSAVYHNSVSANAHARGMQDLLAVLHRLRVFPELQEESEIESLLGSEPEPGRVETPQQADRWRILGGRGGFG